MQGENPSGTYEKWRSGFGEEDRYVGGIISSEELPQDIREREATGELI